MKIIVINETEKHGVTYRLKEMFLEQFYPLFFVQRLRGIKRNHIIY